MTYNEDSAAYVLGSCYYTCFLDYIYYSIPSQINATELNTFLCGDYHRDGQLCGKCKHGFAPSVYSYSLACVECSNYTMNDEDGSKEFTCSQPWFYQKYATNGSAICECGSTSTLERIVRCINKTQLQLQSCYCLTG